MKEWEWDKEGNEYIERILRQILPLLFNQIDDALKEAFKRARYFISFDDLARYVIGVLEEKVNLPPSAKEFIYSELKKIYEKTATEVLKDFPIEYRFDLPDYRAVEFAAKLHDFYLGRFFRGDKELRLRVLKWLSKYYLEEGNPIGKGQKGIKEFLEKFGNYIRPQAEWKARQIIDTSVNFLRNSARLRAMQKAGVRKFRWDAIGDRLTCKYCRALDGRIFEVKEAARVLDMIESSEDPSLLPEIKPFLTKWPLQELRKLPSHKLPVKQPPAHPHCRCRIVSWIEEMEEELPVLVERPPGVPDTPAQRELEEEFAVLTPAEITNKIKAHLGSDWRRMSDGRFDEESANIKRHFTKHGAKMGIKSLHDYEKATFEVIRNPEKVYVQRLPSGETDFVFIKEGKIVVSNDDGLFVKTFHRLYISEEEWLKNGVNKGFATIRIL